MKKIILSITALMMTLPILVLERRCGSAQEPTWEEKWEPLITALIQVESEGNPKALGASGDRGILQITPILVTEANRIQKERRFVHDDAWSPTTSIEIFYVIARKYCPEHDFEKMSRIWNGGPRGPYKQCTDPYWKKVKKELDKYYI